MRSLYRPEQAFTTPRGPRFPEFVDNRHMRVARLSTIRTGRLYSPAETAGTHFSSRVFRCRGHIAAGRIRSTKNDPTGNRAADLPACSAVPQITAPPRTTNYYLYVTERPFETWTCCMVIHKNPISIFKNVLHDNQKQRGMHSFAH